jgi:hypothetical protein
MRGSTSHFTIRQIRPALIDALEYEGWLGLSRFPLLRASPGWVCRSPVRPASERTKSLPQKGLRTSVLLSLESPGGEEEKPSISQGRLEATANKEPAHAFTLHTLVIAVITCSFARWAFGPISLTDCALIYSRASMRARHAPAFPMAKIMLWPGAPQRVLIVTGLGRFMRLDSVLLPCLANRRMHAAWTRRPGWASTPAYGVALRTAFVEGPAFYPPLAGPAPGGVTAFPFAFPAHETRKRSSQRPHNGLRRLWPLWRCLSLLWSITLIAPEQSESARLPPGLVENVGVSGVEFGDFPKRRRSPRPRTK